MPDLKMQSFNINAHFVIEEAEIDKAIKALELLAEHHSNRSSWEPLSEESTVTIVITVKGCEDTMGWTQKLQKQSRGTLKAYLKDARQKDGIKFASTSRIRGQVVFEPSVIFYS